AAVALSNRDNEPGPLTLELARKVHGWGRLHVVELLSESPGLDVRRWLLTEGYKTKLPGGNGYLALLCARAGRLNRALARMRKEDARGKGATASDPGLLSGACDIVLALLKHE